MLSEDLTRLGEWIESQQECRGGLDLSQPMTNRLLTTVYQAATQAAALEGRLVPDHLRNVVVADPQVVLLAGPDFNARRRRVAEAQRRHVVTPTNGGDAA